MKYSIQIIFILLLSFASCRKSTDQQTNSSIINMALTGGISTLDPANSYDTVSATVVYQVYEPLFEYHYLKRPYVLQPLLADSMPQISEDGLKYTIKIKKNIPYHDDKCFKGQTRFVKSEDFVNQIKRLAFLKTASPGWWLFDDKIKGLNEFREKVGSDFSKFFTTNVDGLQTPDENTLVIHLKKPYPQLIYALAMSFTVPMPKEAIIFYNNLLNLNMIGTGPFKFLHWKKNHSVELVRFSHYRDVRYPESGDRFANDNNLLKDAGKKLPFLDRIRFHVMKESQTRWLNFNSNKISMLTVPKDNFSSAITPKGALTDELKKKNVSLQIAPTLIYWWLSFNMTDKLLGKNKNLRLAIAHAVNTEEYIEIFTNNVGQKANSIYPPGIPGYTPTNKLSYRYDLELAKKYLAKAGYPNGRNLPTLNYDVRGNGTTQRQQGEYIKKELAKIGIQINVITNTFPGFLEKTRKGELQFWQDGWSLDYPDAENILQLLITRNHPPSPNTTYYSNRKFDELYDRLQKLQDGEEKFDLMKEMEQIVNRDLPWVMQYYARSYILLHNYVHNYRHSDLVYNHFKYMRVSQP